MNTLHIKEFVFIVKEIQAVRKPFVYNGKHRIAIFLRGGEEREFTFDYKEQATAAFVFDSIIKKAEVNHD